MTKQVADKAKNKKDEQYDIDKAPFSWEKLDSLLLYKSSLDVCAEMLEVSNTTIKNHIQRRFGETFTVYADRKLSKTKVKLVQKAIQMAMSGNTTMMIFSLKNICKWKDNPDEVSVEGKIQIVLPDNKLQDV